MQTYKPVFIIGSYRGGTSLVFRLLSESEELWSLYRESNHLWQKYHRHPQESSDTVIVQKNSSCYFRNLADEKPTTRVDLERKFFDHHYHYATYFSFTRLKDNANTIKLMGRAHMYIQRFINVRM